jgi:hypothetical protein
LAINDFLDEVAGSPTCWLLGSIRKFVYRIVGTGNGAEIFTYR